MTTVSGSTKIWSLEKDGEKIGECHGMSFEDALECFAADWPDLRAELEEMSRADELAELLGASPRRKKTAGGGGGRVRKKGSGARFRELIMAGRSNAEALAIVRAEFPDSRATLSDAAWNRAQLARDPDGFASDGVRVSGRKSR